MRSVPSYVEITGQEVKVLHTYLTNKGTVNDGAHWLSADSACVGSRDPFPARRKS